MPPDWPKKEQSNLKITFSQKRPFKRAVLLSNFIFNSVLLNYAKLVADSLEGIDGVLEVASRMGGRDLAA